MGPTLDHDRHLPRRASSSRSEEHTSELQSLRHLVCRLLLEKNSIGTIRRSKPSAGPRAGSLGCLGLRGVCLAPGLLFPSHCNNALFFFLKERPPTKIYTFPPRPFFHI